ncbi:hypothetical protein ACFH04_27230 [Streptomyces noboritoensis]|uniref:Uncharacterized protein n=1 Tax=Streptomyces noboritoensis TaxID=67337 RepID=A0ABV6TQF8_9ACTN
MNVTDRAEPPDPPGGLRGRGTLFVFGHSRWRSRSTICLLPIEDPPTALAALDASKLRRPPAWRGTHRAHRAAIRESNRRRIDALAGAIPGVAILHLEGKCGIDTMVHTALHWLQTKHLVGEPGLALFNLSQGRKWYGVSMGERSPSPLTLDSARWAEVQHLEPDIDQFIAIAKILAHACHQHRNLPEWHQERPLMAPPGTKDAINLHL